MTTRTMRDSSPVRSGFVHGSLGVLTLAAVFGGAAGTLQVFGDADAAGPVVKMALFETDAEQKPNLKSRLPAEDLDSMVLANGGTSAFTFADEGEPNLGVEYRDAAPSPAPRQASFSEGIRINGRTVMPGQSLSGVQSGQSQVGIQMSAVTQAASAAPVVPEDLTVFGRNSREFTNPEGKPTVSVILGGLGINWRHTQAAIEELPPEVTLSFAPSARNLRRLVRDARAAGHEVLIEVPMEPYDYGRDRPHPQILQVAAGTNTNLARLDRLLSQVSGYMGFVNYKGGKFATSSEAVRPVLTHAKSKGLAVFEDGSLSRSVFEDTASDINLTFARAGHVLDARPDGEEIETRLLMLEADALEHGHALGSGFAYPVTIDMLKAWTTRLESKGILLAPASYHAKRSAPSGQVEIAQLDQAG